MCIKNYVAKEDSKIVDEPEQSECVDGTEVCRLKMRQRIVPLPVIQ